MTSARLVVIRADADAALGIGHVTRCATLASALVQRGYAPHFVTRRGSASLVSRLALEFEVHAIDAIDVNSDVAASRSAIEALGSIPAWLVVDHLDLDDTWERGMRASTPQLLAFDDLRAIRHCVDVLVSDTDVPFLAADSGCPLRKELLGSQYALVASAFAANPRPLVIGEHNVLISYGGSDPTGESEKALAAVGLVRNSVDSDLLGDVTLIVGHANQRANTIIEAANEIDRVHVVYAPSTLAPYLRACDLFLCAGGQSMIEALAVRRPCLVTTTASNQVLGVNRVTTAGLVRSLGVHSALGIHDLVRELALALKDLRRMNAALERSPFDNTGASRIVDAMMAHEATH